MRYPCGIIKDLLPLYIDEVCDEESKQAVENHLAECDACRKYHEAMKATEGYVEKENSDDENMVNSLKTVKNKLHKKITTIVLSVVVAAVTCIGGYHLLFNAAVKDVPLENVSISANVYSVEELLKNTNFGEKDDDSVTISADEGDDSEPVMVGIPEIGGAGIQITMNTLEKYQSLSVVTVKSTKRFISQRLKPRCSIIKLAYFRPIFADWNLVKSTRSFLLRKMERKQSFGADDW